MFVTLDNITKIICLKYFDTLYLQNEAPKKSLFEQQALFSKVCGHNTESPCIR